jgi:glyoxylase-like metal-dependent hydrolase (beta-lactamase superfamily II)
MSPQIAPFFDLDSGTFSYVVFEKDGGECAIVDSVLGYNSRSGRLSTESADRLASFVKERNLSVQWHLETHVHADHLSAAAFLRKKLGGKIAMSAKIGEVRQAFSRTFNLSEEQLLDTASFDHLFNDDEIFFIGRLPACVIAVPGHTPADVAYQICENRVFVGDTIFMPDVGSARCDFPGGDAGSLFRSVQRLLSLSPETEMYVCHDYPPSGRPPMCSTTVKEQREKNIHLHDGVSESDFVAMRTGRDAKLPLPRLIVPSLQVNMQAGELPQEESNGLRYLKVPLDVF